MEAPFYCPHCRNPLSSDDDGLGASVACPACGWLEEGDEDGLIVRELSLPGRPGWLLIESAN